MLESGLVKKTLRIIWHLADIDHDGKMDADEFALCMYLLHKAKQNELMDIIQSDQQLPMEYIPISKRYRFQMKAYWLDYHGEMVDYSQIQYNVIQQTFATHPWKFYNRKTNKLIGAYLPISSYQHHWITVQDNPPYIACEKGK